MDPRPARVGNRGERARDASDDWVEAARAEEGVVPAFVEHDEPLDQRQGEHDLAGCPKKGSRLHRQGDPRPGRQADGPDRQRAGEVRGPEVLELRGSWSGHHFSFSHNAKGAKRQETGAGALLSGAEEVEPSVEEGRKQDWRMATAD